MSGTQLDKRSLEVSEMATTFKVLELLGTPSVVTVFCLYLSLIHIALFSSVVLFIMFCFCHLYI